MPDGSCPAGEFFDGLDARAKAKMSGVMERLAAVGKIANSEAMHKVSSPGSAVYELKVHDGPGYRMYGCYRGKNRFLVTHGRKKPSNKEVAGEAKRARSMIEEWVDQHDR